jgi:putative ABC transport system substrate-binding protein
MRKLKRRTFITLLGGAAAAWPFAAGAQQGGPMRRIGVLMSVAADGPEGQARLAAFLKGLQQWGWTEGRNVRIDTRWGAAMPSERGKMSRSCSRLAPTFSWPAATIRWWSCSMPPA